MNETYHSTNGAFTEALHIYIDKGISQFKSIKSRISVFEMGFGTGLNALLTYQFALKNNLNIDYQTIEKFPISIDEINELNYPNELKIPQLKNIYDQMHQLPNAKTENILDTFSFTKYREDIKSFQLPLNSIDIIYFDAFAPQHQPDLWTEEVLFKMYNSLKPNGFLITYCAQGKFKRTLKSIGFTTIGLVGPPGKREITKAIKKSEKEQ